MKAMTTPLFIVKRDGKEQPFEAFKIRQAIIKAYRAGGVQEDTDKIEKIVTYIEGIARKDPGHKLAVEEIQDLVESRLMSYDPYIAKKYILYRERRTIERDKKTSLKHIMDGIVSIEKNDTNLGNANMSAHTPAGQMMTFASEITKDYTHKYLLSPAYSRAHRDGYIHIHDLDYYPTKTTTCVQYDLEDIFERGFKTKNGSVRTPQSIRSYATLATIVFQTNQNEQHGGQAIPAFDFFMAPGVRKSFFKYLVTNIIFIDDINRDSDLDESLIKEKKVALKKILTDFSPRLLRNDEEADRLYNMLKENNYKISKQEAKHILFKSYDATRKETHQAMEGFIHNLNTMHSRGGNQVVFSSINYGTDTSLEGRMVMRELLISTQEGLGQGEVPIFPIQIFKVKEGINYTDEDYELCMKNFDKALKGELKFKAPNFDLLVLSCQATAKALFPNFLFLDTPFNKNDLWKADDPKRYLYEIATMGCRTRVFENVRGEKSSVGRGNLSFTSINLPRLAIEAMREAEEYCPDGSKERLRMDAREIFLQKVRRMATLAADQLHDRYLYQRTALARQFPFMMSNNVWKGGIKLDPNDEVEDVIATGTLGIGFIGGHNAMVAIYGEGHAHNKDAWNTLYDAIMEINKVADEYKAKYNLNYSVLATPAEGLSGRFTKMDRKRFGIIPGVTDLDYYVNSFHIDVREPVSIAEKIKLEAPFHAVCRGGHITYVELDGEAKKNVSVMLKIVKAMKDANIGYGSINHPVDTCQKCGYRGVIYSKCPVCQSEKIARLRRITGYLTGSLETWNSAKQAEEHDRVKHH